MMKIVDKKWKKTLISILCVSIMLLTTIPITLISEACDCGSDNTEKNNNAIPQLLQLITPDQLHKSGDSQSIDLNTQQTGNDAQTTFDNNSSQSQSSDLTGSAIDEQTSPPPKDMDGARDESSGLLTDITTGYCQSGTESWAGFSSTVYECLETNCHYGSATNEYGPPFSGSTSATTNGGYSYVCPPGTWSASASGVSSVSASGSISVSDQGIDFTGHVSSNSNTHAELNPEGMWTFYGGIDASSGSSAWCLTCWASFRVVQECYLIWGADDVTLSHTGSYSHDGNIDGYYSGSCESGLGYHFMSFGPRQPTNDDFDDGCGGYDLDHNGFDSGSYHLANPGVLHLYPGDYYAIVIGFGGSSGASSSFGIGGNFDTKWSTDVTNLNAGSSVHFKFAPFDLDVDSDNTHNEPDYGPERTAYEDQIEATSPKYVMLNNDDDNGNDIPDYQETTPVSNEDDWVKMVFEISPVFEEIYPNARINVQYYAPGDNIRIWKGTGSSATFLLPGSYPISELNDLWVEGVNVGGSTVTFDLSQTPGGSNIASDTVTFSVIPNPGIDLDIDSDNTCAIDHSLHEDQIEDTAPGKIIAANTGDGDSDGIPDFADGFNWDGIAGNADDICSVEQFTPITLTLPGSDAIPNLNNVRLRFTYSASDPVGVTFSNGVYTPAPGDLRIWKKDENLQRNKNPVSASGDYIAPGEYLATQLGFTAPGQTKTFFIEGTTPSSQAGDQRIKVEIDPDGSGSLPYITSDAVRLTVLNVNLDIDSDNSGAIVHEQDDPIEAIPPGKFIALNADDDNGNGVPDMNDHPFNPTDNDLEELQITVSDILQNSPLGQYNWKLTYPSDKIRIWGMIGAFYSQIPSDELLSFPTPSQLYIEGIGTSSSCGDVTITLTVIPSGAGACPFTATDQVKATVIGFDLGIDSDNNGVINLDDNRIEENSPGKYIKVNNDDDNNDGQADFCEMGAISGENDLAELKITFGIPDTCSGTLQWLLTYDSQAVNIWRNPDRSGPVFPESLQSDFPSAGLTLYVEGIESTEPSSVDIQILLQYTYSGGSVVLLDKVTDKVVATVYQPYFIQVSDIHWGQEFNNGMPANGYGASRWKAFKNEVLSRDKPPEFIICTGDLVDYAYATDASGNFLYTPYSSFVQTMDGGIGNWYWRWQKGNMQYDIPLIFCPGNHDAYINGPAAVINNPTLIYIIHAFRANLVFPPYDTSFSMYNAWIGFPQSRTIGMCKIVPLNSGYDAFPWGGFPNPPYQTDPPGGWIKGLLSPEGVGFTSQALDSLANELASVNNNYVKIIALHHPHTNPNGNNGDVNDERFWNGYLQFVNICTGNNVDYVLSGHTHLSNRNRASWNIYGTIMPLDQIQGTKCYDGGSLFKGTGINEFKIEVPCGRGNEQGGQKRMTDETTVYLQSQLNVEVIGNATVNVYDQDDHHTGPDDDGTEVGIPGSSYSSSAFYYQPLNIFMVDTQIGLEKSSTSDYHVVLHGLVDDTINVELYTQDESGDYIIASYQDVTILEGSIATLDAPSSEINYVMTIHDPDGTTRTVIPTFIEGDQQGPLAPPIFTGPTEGIIQNEYQYSANAFNPNGNDVYYMWDWNDNTPLEWNGPFPSGTMITTTHKWIERNIYNVRVKVKDSLAESEWSTPLQVKIAIPADMNNDGRVTFADIDPFVAALSGKVIFSSQYPNSVWLAADCNQDGMVNFADIDFFVSLLSNSPPASPSTPEGPSQVYTGVSSTYNTHTIDLENNTVRYGWDWDGDGVANPEDWTDYVVSGASVSTSHSWSVAGTYHVQVKAQDSLGAMSVFSPSLPVVVFNPLTLTVYTNGEGSVQLDPPGGIYAYGQTVVLTATPVAGWSFDHWGGDLSGSTNPTTITMTGNKAITTYFSQNQYTLTVNLVGNGTVSKNPNQSTYTYGQTVALTAIPDSGWSFDHWGGNISGYTNPTTITMNGNKTITANFAQNQYTITISIDPAGKGSVAKNPDQTTYTYGQVITLTASPIAGWSFDHWNGDINGNTNPKPITLTGNTTVIANFSQNQYTLALNIDPVGKGSVAKNPDQTTYTYGQIVTLTASPIAGWSFDHWGGDAEGNENPLEVDMYSNKTITAYFAHSPPNIPSQPSGPTAGNTSEMYVYSTVTTDPENNNVRYGWDWDGDGVVNPADWTGYVASGTSVSTSHVWSAAGTYQVQVKAQNIFGAESAFSLPLIVMITYVNHPPSIPSLYSYYSFNHDPFYGGLSIHIYSMSTDPDGDPIYYLVRISPFDMNPTWKGPYASGQSIHTIIDTFPGKGYYDYFVMVKAKDIHGAESNWSAVKHFYFGDFMWIDWFIWPIWFGLPPIGNS